MPTILVVDDLAADREFLVTLLQREGYRLLQAADGREGLAVVQAERPDLVITDMLMPVMDGYEFVRRLHLDPTTAAIPVVIYTASYGAREARALALSSSVSAFLTKVAEPQDVLGVVRRLLSPGEDAGVPQGASAETTESDGEYLRLLRESLDEQAGDLNAANARLRALINIGLELASERDPIRLIHNVCVAVRDLFGATYVTLGILDLQDRTVQQVVTCGANPATWIKTGDPISGILGTVVAKRRAVRGNNPGGDPVSLQLPALHPAIEAFVAAPIASPRHVYGWLCLVANRGRAFTEEDEDLVRALSGQVGRIYENGYFHAVAEKRAADLEHEVLERMRAEEDSRRRAQLSALSAAVGLSLTGSDSLAHALQRCAEAIVTHLDGAFTRIWTLDESAGVLELQASAGLYTRVNGHYARVLLGQFKVGRIARDQKPHLTNDIGGDPEITDHDWARREGMAAFAGHPLIVGDRVVGVMALFARHTLSDAVLSALASIADHVALGIERHRGVEALRLAEERMRFALESAGVGIWDMNYTTGVLRWSETVEAHYGLRPGTFGGTFDAFVERVHPDDRESVLETFGRAIRSGADFSLQHRSVWPDGTVRWLTGAGRVRLDQHGQAERGLGISLDITARRTLELQYQQAQKMEAIGRLAGGVAHDFNNLLTAILGGCDLLLGDTEADDPRREDMLEIQKAGVSAAGLTRQLLAFSRKQIVEPTLLDLNVVVADMQAMVQRLIGEDVKVVLVLRPGLARVLADRTQAEQIVLNLAVNARDAMPSGGTLTIETANVDLDEVYAAAHPSVTPGPHVALTIADTGTGMTPQVQARLFEPFFTTKDVGKGTGLGLSTVHGIVTRSLGSVTVESHVGRGTALTVYFPRAEGADVAAAPPSPSRRSDTGTRTVLVVEDAAGLRDVIARLLRREGYAVLAAANGEEATEVFERSGSIDVLLTDVVMPGASGPELARQLIERRPGLRVIYMSGYAEPMVGGRGILTPGIAFLRKPFTADALAQRVRDVLGR